MRLCFFFILGCLVSWAAVAADAMNQASPVGLWKTFDSDTGKEDCLVRIVEINGELTGRVEQLLDPADSPDTRCEKCMDDRKNQPVLGMVIMRGVKRQPGEKPVWSGGSILDPDSGKVYRARLRLRGGGKKLEVTGYLALPFAGQSEIWLRVDTNGYKKAGD